MSVFHDILLEAKSSDSVNFVTVVESMPVIVYEKWPDDPSTIWSVKTYTPRAGQEPELIVAVGSFTMFV